MFLLNCINLFLSLNGKTMALKNDRIIHTTFITALSKRSCQHIENETAADEEGGGGGADKKEMSNFIFSPPRHFLFRSAAAA